MGLLDPLLGNSFDDPKTMAALNMAQGLLSAQRPMQGLASGMQGYQQAMMQAKEQKRREEAQAIQMQMQQMALEQAKRQQGQQALQDQFRSSIPSPQMQASQGALAGGGGPTLANAAQMPAVDPQASLMHGALQSGLMSPMDYINSQRKDTTPIKLGAGDGLYDPKTLKPLVVNPKGDTTPSAVKEYEFAKSQGYPGTFRDFTLEGKRAGASSVSVNTGQHGFDNTLKLRSDFRSEPIYKAFQEMQSSYSQIQQGLKLNSPAGDLAGATKVMKLLDPGSVVRESELGMAMAATGLLDRIQNYAQMTMSGQKLNPAQRRDFQNLADKLYGESVKQYNLKRSEYEQIASRNGLSVPDVIGTQAVGATQSTKQSGGVKFLGFEGQ